MKFSQWLAKKNPNVWVGDNEYSQHPWVGQMAINKKTGESGRVDSVVGDYLIANDMSDGHVIRIPIEDAVRGSTPPR